MKKITTKQVAGLGILTALTVVFGLISNYIQFGPASLNISLIPIAIAAILYGPFAGLYMGVVNGCMCMLAPSTATFFGMSVYGTIIICFFKTGVGGLVSGFLYKLLSKKNLFAGVCVAACVVPIINTGLFIVGATIFFQAILADLISLFIGFNFAFEFLVTAILSPAIARIIIKRRKRYE